MKTARMVGPLNKAIDARDCCCRRGSQRMFFLSPRPKLFPSVILCSAGKMRATTRRLPRAKKPTSVGLTGAAMRSIFYWDWELAPRQPCETYGPTVVFSFRGSLPDTADTLAAIAATRLPAGTGCASPLRAAPVLAQQGTWEASAPLVPCGVQDRQGAARRGDSPVRGAMWGSVRAAQDRPIPGPNLCLEAGGMGYEPGPWILRTPRHPVPRPPMESESMDPVSRGDTAVRRNERANQRRLCVVRR
jgi:hypothetical protein